jgi:hypothetical protein
MGQGQRDHQYLVIGYDSGAQIYETAAAILDQVSMIEMSMLVWPIQCLRRLMLALRCPGGAMTQVHVAGAVIERVIGLLDGTARVGRISILARGINHKAMVVLRVVRIPNGILLEG